MAENRQTSRWTRGVALIGLVSLLSLWLATASHVHIAANQGSVRQDCQFCVFGTGPVLTATSPLVPASAEVMAVLLPDEPQRRSLFLQFVHSPRSPPFVS